MIIFGDTRIFSTSWDKILTEVLEGLLADGYIMDVGQVTGGAAAASLIP